MANFSNSFFGTFSNFDAKCVVNGFRGVLRGSQKSALFANRIISVRVLTLNIVIFLKRFSTKALAFLVIFQWIALSEFLVSQGLQTVPKSDLHSGSSNILTRKNLEKSFPAVAGVQLLRRFGIALIESQKVLKNLNGFQISPTVYGF